MEFKGTHGKWIIEQGIQNFNEYGVPYVEISSSMAKRFASVYEHSASGKANALLISKAPEILEMLSILISKLDEIELSNNQQEEIVPLMADAEKLINEATEF